jgi:Fe-S-cluster containining protein
VHLESVSPEERKIHLADFQAFVCNGCGLCCTRPWNVRIEPEIEQGVRNSELYRRREREGYVPLEVLENKINANRQGNGHCMFLTEEILCGLHSELGSQGKPVGCQLYPYRPTTTPSGTYFTLSFACPSVVAGKSADLEANRSDLTTILAKWPQAADWYGEALLAQDQVQGVTWESYLMLEEWMMERYDPRRPLDSLLEIACIVSAIAMGEAGWPPPAEPPLELELLRDLLKTYLTAIVSIIENEKDHAARAPYADAVNTGSRMPSCYLGDGLLPGLSLDRSLPDWALETFHRFVRNQILGKSVLTPSVVSKLLAMAIGFVCLCHYAEGFRLSRSEEQLSLQSLTLAFEVVEADVVSHSSALAVFYNDFEATIPKFFGT